MQSAECRVQRRYVARAGYAIQPGQAAEGSVIPGDRLQAITRGCKPLSRPSGRDYKSLPNVCLPSRVPAIILFVLLVLLLALPSVAATYTKNLADGVSLVQEVNTDPKSPRIVTTVRVNPNAAGVGVTSTIAGDTIIPTSTTKGRETISALVARKGAFAGVNGDYFWNGDPAGLAIVGGELVSEPIHRAAIGMTPDGRIIIDRLGFSGRCTAPSGSTFELDGVNRPRAKNEMVLFRPVFGDSTGTKEGVEVALTLPTPVRVNSDIEATVAGDPAPTCNSPIPASGAILSAHGPAADWLTQNLRQGDNIRLRLDVIADSGRSWSSVTDAIGGGPWLVKRGSIYIDSAEQKFKPDVVNGRNPRTAVGVTASGELLMVAVDGRQPISAGVTLDELAVIMKRLGAVDAINLDGGGSTSLSIRGIVTNSPSGGRERLVGNALLVYAGPHKQSQAFVFGETEPVTALSGEGRAMRLMDNTGQPVSEDALAGIVWGTTGGIGFVNQMGYFVPIKAGKGSIVALSGDSRAELPVVVVPGQPAKLTAKIVKDASAPPNIGQVEAALTDANGNGIEGKPVSITVKGGIADCNSISTDANGKASFLVTWDTTADAATVVISSAGMTAKAR